MTTTPPWAGGKGGSAALPAWLRSIGAALADQPPTELSRIDPVTGLRTADWDGVVEVFVQNTAPTIYVQPAGNIFIENKDDAL